MNLIWLGTVKSVVDNKLLIIRLNSGKEIFVPKEPAMEPGLVSGTPVVVTVQQRQV